MSMVEVTFEELFCSKARNRIIKILAERGELNISKIIKEANLNHTMAETHLEFLKETGLIQEKRFGRIRIFRFKQESPKARGIINFISLMEGGT